MFVSTPSYVTGCCLWSFLVECLFGVVFKLDCVEDVTVIFNALCKDFVKKLCFLTPFFSFDNRDVLVVFIGSVFVMGKKGVAVLTAVIKIHLLF